MTHRRKFDRLVLVKGKTVTNKEKLDELNKEFCDLKLNCWWEDLLELLDMHEEFLNINGWKVDQLRTRINHIQDEIDKL